MLLKEGKGVQKKKIKRSIGAGGRSERRESKKKKEVACKLHTCQDAVGVVYHAQRLLINEAINCVDRAIEEIFSEVQSLSRFTLSLHKNRL